MSNVLQLSSDLQNLATEAKRRFPDIKQGCDKASADLRTYQPTLPITEIHNETHKQDIISPLVKAIKTGNAKIATIAIPIIHKLIATKTIPSGSMGEVLEGLREASNLAIDIQLRILQCLPSLTQSYSLDIKGDLLTRLLGICASLTTNNKSTVVINTASATLQQLFSNVFDKDQDTSEDDAKSFIIKTDGETPLHVNEIQFETFNIFQDLCSLIENERPAFYLTEFVHMKTGSILEIVENIISGHKILFNERLELTYLLRVKLIPSLLRILSSTVKSFPLVTRTMRVILVLLSSQLTHLEIESEVILSFLNHILLNNNEPDYDIQWEKILVLELYKGLFADFNTIKSIFEKYDNNDKKKNVIQELNSILTTYLQNESVLVVNETLRPLVAPTSTAQSLSGSGSPGTASHTLTTQLHLSRSSSNMKVSILDHLDKTEPPHSIPPTYPVYIIYQILLLYSEGIANFVQNLSNNTNPSTLEADVEFTNYFIEASYHNITNLFEYFIYFDMDNESFHLLIRSLQRFTHATGLLGLSGLRDGLLLILSRAIINNEDSREDNKVSGSSTFQDQGKQLLAFGESLVESITGAQSPQLDSPNNNNNHVAEVLRSRNFNSRHVTCLRALANLGVSLGSTLQSSWKIIWVTFQWCEYYVHGPDEYSGYLNHKGYKKFQEHMLPRLTQQDYVNLETSKKKLFDSINEFPIDSFKELLSSLIGLAGEANNEDDMANGKKESSKSEKLQSICPYNKTFFLTNVLKVSQVNSNKFLIYDDSIWDVCCNYFIKVSTKRSTNYKLRIHYVNTFNALIKHITSQGFGSKVPETNAATAKKSLNGLKKFLNSIFDLGIPKELLVLNCETEIHHLSLSTLHELIDEFDTYYQNSWNTVFEILNTPFRTTTWYNEDNNLKEKVRLLIDSSFHTLKLILDEFMSTLPFSQLKLLIDTLRNFCSQTFDLNTSFSSVSYFWLISDSLKVRIGSDENVINDFETLSSIGDEKQLVELIERTDDQTAESSQIFYIALDIYLLATLVKLSTDQRDQVRDGSIQTFFQIIDVHGTLLSTSASWDLVYKIVFPTLFDLKIDLNEPKYHKKEWIESFSLIFSGLVSIFNKFMMDFKNINQIDEKWQVLIQYFKRLLEFKWLELNMKIFRSFQELLIPFQKESNGIPNSIKQLLFDFWVHVPIEYDFVNPSYQDSTAALMECFPQLYVIIRDTLTSEDTKTIINHINKCARYPVLPSNNLDDTKPTQLQKSSIDILKTLDIKDKNIESQVVQQLSSMIIYPFGTKSRIEQKLVGNKAITSKYKIPTFIAISHLSTQLLKEKLDTITDFSILLEDKGINKILRSLLELVGNKSRGIEKDNVLWVEASQILQSLVNRVIEAPVNNSEVDEELWKLIMSVVKICITEDRNEFTSSPQSDQDEAIKTKQYHELIPVVLPKLLENSNTELVGDFIKTLYDNSFLYEFDEVEQALLKEHEGVSDALIEGITSYDFDEFFGSTQPLEKFKNKNTRIQCLGELIKYSQTPQNSHLNTISQRYLISRVAFCLRRFVSDEKLLYRCPISKIQTQEIVMILRGIQTVDITSENKALFNKLHRTLIKVIEFGSRIDGLTELIESALGRFL